ncbi:MAG TPA: molybdate ABC transporter substrate-binding protein [Candidatus Onthomonas avicola]|nr:molybdate ABC transporter substrate-binding protein [Candidatus Onthomonas avicola]
MKRLLSVFLALLMLLALTACGGDTAGSGEAETPEEPASDTETAGDEASADAGTEETSGEPLEATEIQVFIAASLDNAFQELVELYRERQPNVTVTLNADSSGTLLTQIQEGYACDIFFSAATRQMDQLAEDGLMVEGTRTDLLGNEVVLITWQGSGTAVTGMDNLSEASSIALADGSVPVGQYTRTVLQNMGLLDSSLTAADITTQEVSDALGGVEINECGNVSQVLQAVAEGSNEVGTVYYSDAYSEMDRVEILEHIPTDLSGEIIYPVAQVVNPEADELESAAAADFLAFLQTDEAMEVFTAYQFLDHR